MDDRFLIAKLINEGYVPLEYTSPTMDWLLEQGYAAEVDKKYGGKRWTLTPLGHEWFKATPTKTMAVQYEEHFEVIREPNVDDEWDHGTKDYNASFVKVIPAPDAIGPYYETSIQIPADMTKATFVWCRYTSGSTFGKTHGRFGYGDFAYTAEGIKLIEEVMKQKYDDYFGGVDECYHESVEIP